jgi:uncharacterized membrane protein
METTLNVLGFSLLAIITLFCLLFLFSKGLYRKIDRAFERFLAVLVGNIVIVIGIITLLVGVFVVGFQVYAWLTEGQWIDQSLLGVTKASIAEHISGLFTRLNAELHLGKVSTYALEKIPLSIFLLLIGLFVAFLGFAIRERDKLQDDENGKSESPQPQEEFQQDQALTEDQKQIGPPPHKNTPD